MNNRGYQGLFSTVDRNQQAKDNLVVLEQLSNINDKKRKEEQEAQAQAAAIQDQIRKETSQLLGHDKKAIQERARQTYNLVRTQLAANGGNYSSFMNNGGRAMLETYKNAVLNSNEMADYNDNQKNMATILEMQKSGKGHLINNIDRQSMLDYQRNRGGRISYTGTLSEIEMPDLKNYDWGTDIPAIHILKHGKNKLAIMNNYMLNHPDLPQPPSDDALIQYVKQNYYGRGSNFEKAHAERRMDQAERQLDQADDRLAWEKESFFHQLQYQYDTANVGGGSGSGGGSKSELEKLEEESAISNVVTALGTVNGAEGVPLSKFLSGDFTEQFSKGTIGNLLGDVGAVKSNIGSYENNFIVGEGLTSKALRKMGSKFSPVNAMEFKGLDKTAAAKTVIGDQYEIKNGVVKGIVLNNHGDWYSGNGQEVRNAKGFFYNRVNGAGTNPRDFKIFGVVQVGVAEQGGKKSIIVKKSGDKDFNYKDVKGNVKLEQMVALHDPKTGEVFYAPFNVTQSTVQAKYQKYAEDSDNLSRVRKTTLNTNNKIKTETTNAKNQIEFNKRVYESFKGDTASINKLKTRSKITSGGNSGKRTGVFFAVNSAAASVMQEPAMFAQLADVDFVESTLDKIKQRNPNALGREILANNNFTNKQIIQYIANNAEDDDDRLIFTTALEHLDKIKGY